jgi:hypothetical protein
MLMRPIWSTPEDSRRPALSIPQERAFYPSCSARSPLPRPSCPFRFCCPRRRRIDGVFEHHRPAPVEGAGPRAGHCHRIFFRVSFGRRDHSGRIIAAGITKEVTFEPVDGPINDQIDTAYRAKYGNSPYLQPMISARARFATIRIMPRETPA